MILMTIWQEHTPEFPHNTLSRVWLWMIHRSHCRRDTNLGQTCLPRFTGELSTMIGHDTKLFPLDRYIIVNHTIRDCYGSGLFYRIQTNISRKTIYNDKNVPHLIPSRWDGPYKSTNTLPKWTSDNTFFISPWFRTVDTFVRWLVSHEFTTRRIRDCRHLKKQKSLIASIHFLGPTWP